MPTPSEQKALAFVAIVILLGGAVRVLRAGPSIPSASEQQGVARQARASDSAAAASAVKPRARGRARKPTVRDTIPHVIGGVASVPPSYARPAAGAQARIDIDHATAEQIEKLPRIGPAMARRIVANRDSLGPFKTPAGLRRVKGMGPATLARLTPLITFSAAP